MRRAYTLATECAAPLLPLWLLYRRLRGKEDGARIRERFGYPSAVRPKGSLLWLHAASVGESVSVLPLIATVRARYPKLHILITTGTKTSAELMKRRLPAGVIHQYVPLDTPAATWRFMRHWRPELAFFVESELWPNLIFAADSWQCFMGMLNARLSEKSFRFWSKYSSLIKAMLQCFNIAFAQSEADKTRLVQLGAKSVFSVGNMKYDGAALPGDEVKLVALHTAIGMRPVWLAASTHPGEEIQIATVHDALVGAHPSLLTIIVPRHPARGAEIAGELQKTHRIGLRSRGDMPTANTAIYIADTLGELGVFYRACQIVFMGGSLVAHGGQNPLEPARLSCAVITGPHTHNFRDVYRDLETARACLRVSNSQDLARRIDQLLSDSAKSEALQNVAKLWVESQAGATSRVLDILAPVLSAENK